MSDLFQADSSCQSRQQPCKAIRMILEPQEKDLGGFSVRRLLPTKQLKSIGPFVFFDHLGPADFPPGQGIDVRPHPHIGLATVTYLFSGEILHRDSLGVVQPIRPGEINWMTAGRGVVHSERTPPEIRAQGHTLHALQLWVALPEAVERIDPAFAHHEGADLPLRQEADRSIRVLLGEAYGLRSAVQTYSPTLYLEVELQAGATLALPDSVPERAVYLISGELQAAGTPLTRHSMTLFEPQPGIELQATQTSRLAIIGGEPIGPRTIWWNLVASDKQLIEQAKRDWREGRFGKVPGETEFIPLPE